MERRPTSLFKLRRSQGFFTLASSVLLWWTQRDLNPRPLRCERSALPAELWALKDYVIIILLCRHFCNSFLHFFVVRLKKWCGRRDLNPHDCSPDPKSGASANSATSAYNKKRAGHFLPGFWLGRQDSNLRITEPKPVALPLGDAPKKNGVDNGDRTHACRSHNPVR